MKRLVGAAALLLVASACTNERAESLRAEIEKAKTERVEVATVEKARQETAAAEAALAASRAALEQARADAAKLEADRDQMRAALAAEVARNDRLRNETEAVARRAQERSARGQELDASIERRRARATWVRDQAATFAREIRPADPDWATARRLDALREFVAGVASEYPDDPVIAELARSQTPAGVSLADRARASAERAAQVRDRFAAVYELASPDVAAGKPQGDAGP